MLDLSLRIGFELRVCSRIGPRPRGRWRAGQVCERQPVPSIRFTDDADLNRQSLDVVRQCGQPARARDDGPASWEMLPRSGSTSAGCRSVRRWRRISDDRRVAHDGYVHWEGSRYGVPWRWAGANGPGGTALGDGGDLGRRPALGGASPRRTPRAALHRAGPVGRVAQGDGRPQQEAWQSR